MSIGNCPKCNDRVLLPAGASAKATVSCPLCKEQFSLAEIYDQLPPTLVVLDDPEAVAAENVTSASPTSDSTDWSGDLEFAKSDSDATPSTEPAFSFDEVSDSSATSASKPKSRRPAARPKRKKQKNPMVEVIKVVVGGVVGLSIAQLLLWWWPWWPLADQSSTRRDPIHLAAPISKVVPWIVPESLRVGSNGQTSATADADVPFNADPDKVVSLSETGLPSRTFTAPGTAEDGDQPTDNSSSEQPNSNDNITPAIDTSGGNSTVNAGSEEDPFAEPAGEPAIPAFDPFDTAPDIGLDPTVESPGGGISLDNDLLNSSDNGAESMPISDPESIDHATAKQDPAAEQAQGTPAGPAPVESLIGTRRTSVAEIRAAMEEAQSMQKAWTNAEQIDQSLAIKSFAKFAAFGESLAFADQRPNGETLAAADDLLVALSADPQKLDVLGGVGAVWTGYAARKNNGIFLAGTVKDLSKDGDRFETTIETFGKGKSQTLSIYSPERPAADLAPGSRAIFLGVIIEKPGETIVGYDGADQSVIWLGHAKTIAEP